GIRDRNVTGVQTCALPIWAQASRPHCGTGLAFLARSFPLECLCTTNLENVCALHKFLRRFLVAALPRCVLRDQKSLNTKSTEIRSEERRVGKEWRTVRSP